MEERRTMKEAFDEIEKAFHAIPEWERIFKKYEWELRHYNRMQWNERTTKEKLANKRDELLKVAKSLDYRDLMLLYYVKKFEGTGIYRLVEVLEKFARAQCEKTGEEDISLIGKRKSGGKEKKYQKNPEI